MKRVIYYPNLEIELTRLGITKSELAKVINTELCTLYNKLSGKTDFKLSEAFGIQVYLSAKDGLDDQNTCFALWRDLNTLFKHI